jgi:hypothetical protein
MQFRIPERRTSELFQGILDTTRTDTVSLGQFITLLGERAFPFVIFLLALPNALPLSGGPFTVVTGIGIFLMGFQMFKGRETIWLPSRIAGKPVSIPRLKRILKKVQPGLTWFERYVSPRMEGLCRAGMGRLLGLLVMILALLVVIPVPGGSHMLPALALALIAIGLLEKDGLFVACAACFSVICLLMLYPALMKFVASLIQPYL